MVPAVPRGMRPYLDGTDIHSPGLWTQQGTDKHSWCHLPFSFPISLLWTHDLHDICAYLLQGNHCPFSVKDRTFLTHQLVQKGSCWPKWRLSAFVWCFIVIQRGECKGWPVPPKAQPQMKHHVVLALLSIDLTDKTQSSAGAELGQGRARLSPPSGCPITTLIFHLLSLFHEKIWKFSCVLHIVPAIFVETQKPLWPQLPQHVLPTGCSSRDVYFPTQPTAALTVLYSVQTSVRQLCLMLSVFPWQSPNTASSLKSALVLLACSNFIQRKQILVWMLKVGLISVMSPLHSCSRSFLSGMGQANKNVTGRN